MTCNVQRDTEKRSKKLYSFIKKNNFVPSWNVFLVVLKNHSGVSKDEITEELLFEMAQLDMLELIDGHTREYLDIMKKIQLPEKIMLMVILEEDIVKISDLYDSADSSGAHKTCSDIVCGMMRKYLGHLPKQSILKNSNLKTAFEIAFNSGVNIDVSELYGLMDKHPLAFNALKKIERHPTKFLEAKFPTVILAGMLLSVLRDGDRALSFWSDYNNDLGSTTKGYMDAIQMMSQYRIDLLHYASTKNKNPTKPAEFHTPLVGRDGHEHYLPKVLSYYNGWTKGKPYKTKMVGGWYVRAKVSMTVKDFLGGKSYLEYTILN
ncbi:hypothetical protein VB10N_00500 [Vibrio sp. 10N]|nr:hypothetical protein VB10N_00500 [Vibrio sp. 10N]